MSDLGLPETAKFMSDFWQLIKTYYNPPDDPDASYWPDLVRDAGNIGKKYEKDNLCIRLLQTFLTYVEEKYRLRKGEQK